MNSQSDNFEDVFTGACSNDECEHQLRRTLNSKKNIGGKNQIWMRCAACGLIQPIRRDTEQPRAAAMREEVNDD